MAFDVFHNRTTAQVSSPNEVADKVARIRQLLDHNRRQRLHNLTTPTNAAERFAAAEAQNEAERDRHA